MDTQTPDRHMIEAGRALLRATDDLGMAAQGAAWVYSPSLEDWRYYLVSSIVDDKGPRWVYERLAKAWHRLKLPDDFSVVDVHLASPNDPLFREITSRARIYESSFGPSQFGHFHIGGNYFYRMEPAPGRSVTKRAETKFDYRVRQLLAA